MPSTEDQPGLNSLAGNSGAQPADATTKMGADARNTAANSSLQPATPAMQPAAPTTSDTTSTPPTSKELAGSEMSAGQGGVDGGGKQENREATPADVAAGPAPADPHQPNAYGGNFGNDVQDSFQDHDRASNQRSDPNRGEFGQQAYNQGATHGGYGNQYRETNYPHHADPAEKTAEEKYYGDGSGHPGPQHNSYRAYDGRDLVPDQQGHAVPDDTPPAATARPGSAASTDGRGNAQDNRNLPGRADEAAAFQNDNGAVKTGAGYAADYGHTSGVGLPAATPDNHQASPAGSRNQQEDQHSSRGGYDNQGSQGGRSHDQQPGGNAPAGQQAPAPVNSPDAPQPEGYGYGHARSEEAERGNPQTGDSRNGFGPGGSQEGSVGQGHGSQGGSYDDQNPGARGPEYDGLTQQDKAKNYGQANRDDYRPADDQPQESDHGAAPRRNAGRDEENG